MAADFSSQMTVTLERHVDKVIGNSPIGPTEFEVVYDQYKCWVEGERVQTTSRKLMVGYIGTHVGANFCPLPSFYKFPRSIGQWIVDQVKAKHGHASPDQPVDVPPPESMEPL